VRPDWQLLKRRLVRAIADHQMQDEIDWQLHDWEREAADRVVRALVQGMHAEQRYEMDAHFHRAIDTIAQIAAAAVLNEPSFTREEVERRRIQFDQIELAEPFGLFPHA